VNQTYEDWLVARAMARKHDDARRAYQDAQRVAYEVYTTGGSPRLVDASLARLMRARWALVAAEGGR
jgi:hypothetical protein